MNKLFLKILLAAGILINQAQATDFLCTNETIVKDYLSAARSNVDGATKYATEDSCKGSCKTSQSCEYASKDMNDFTVFSPSKFLDEETATDAVNYLKNSKILSFTVSKDGVSTTVTPTSPTLFSGISFPVQNPTVSAPIKSSSFSVGSNTTVKLSKLLLTKAEERVFSGTTISLNDINTLISQSSPGADAFGVKYIAINGEKIDLGLNGAIVNQVDFNVSSTTLYSDATNYVKFKQTTSSGVTTNSIEYKVNGSVKTAFANGNSATIAFGSTAYDTSTVWYAIDFTISGTNYNMEDGFYVDSTGTTLQHWVSVIANMQNIGYVCPMYQSGVDIGGDLNPNLFSTKSSCDLKCSVQNDCVMWSPSNCELVGAVETAPVTDYTGKNVNTKKTYSWKCSKSTSELERCDAYSIQQNNGKLNYAIAGAGWETKDFSASFTQSVAGSYMFEQMQHIWSGWGGYCENGTKYDSSWMSDPMQLMSFAMMAYDQFGLSEYVDKATTAIKTSEAVAGATKAAADTAKTVSDAATKMYESATSMFTSGAATGTAEAAKTSIDIGKTIGEAADAVSKAYTEAKGVFDSYNNFYELYSIGGESVWLSYTDLLGTALAAIGDIENSDVQTADSYFQALLGSASETSEAVRYANCMASIGLSFPNMMAFTVDDNSTSNVLKEPYNNPMRVTFQEMAEITAVMGPQYVAENYGFKELDESSQMMTIIAGNGAALTNAGSIICAADPAVAAAGQQLQSIPSDSSGASKGEAVANAAIQTALSKLPPPYGFFAALAFKVLTSFSDGNACTDEKIATQWGPEQLRTNKALKGNQCHNTRNDCVKKWFWGSCMLHGSWYCCYDQEITRIFVEGLKEQLGKDWSSCNDLTIYDLKNISFRPCEATETPQANKCFPSAKYDELVGTVTKNATKNLSPDVIIDQATNGLALPGRDPWAQ